jgi:hypothetical protein
MELIYPIAAFFSALAAVLAWVAKLMWGKEYMAAKDETIKAKEAHIEVLKSQIESLRELTPVKMKEYFATVKATLEEYNETLQLQLNEAKKEIDQKTIQIDHLYREGEKKGAEFGKLEYERDQIRKRAEELESKLKQLREKQTDKVIFRFPTIDLKTIESVAASSAALGKAVNADSQLIIHLEKLKNDIQLNFQSFTKAFQDYTIRVEEKRDEALTKTEQTSSKKEVKGEDE